MKKPETDVVISRQNLPSSFRFGALVAYWLLLAHFNAPTWAFYLFYAFAAIVTIGALVRMMRTTQINLTAAAEIQEVMRTAPSCCAAGEASPTIGANKFTIKALQIQYERIGANTVRVTLRDANGKELYRFRDYEVHEGTTLILNGVRAEVDLDIN